MIDKTLFRIMTYSAIALLLLAISAVFVASISIERQEYRINETVRITIDSIEDVELAINGLVF